MSLQKSPRSSLDNQGSRLPAKRRMLHLHRSHPFRQIWPTGLQARFAHRPPTRGGHRRLRQRGRGRFRRLLVGRHRLGQHRFHHIPTAREASMAPTSTRRELLLVRDRLATVRLVTTRPRPCRRLLLGRHRPDNPPFKDILHLAQKDLPTSPIQISRRTNLDRPSSFLQ